MNRPLLQLTTLVALLILGVPIIKAQTEFEQAVAERGYDQDIEDLSAESEIEIAEPSLALVNLTGFTSMPTQKNVKRDGYMEVFDGNGYYFRKPVELGGQGGYSLRFPKNNFVCHFTDEQWNEDYGAELTIGDWVSQNSFHFKAFYTDYPRGIGEVAYKLFAQMVADRRPYWERGGYMKDSRARCFPDGFPCVVYLNGKFHGIYAWQLKKNRKNMNQKKALDTHIHLDGDLSDNHIFRGTIVWKNFEVRTPKGLIDIKGAAYDGNKPKELMDESSPLYQNAADTDSLRQVKQLSALTKHHIVAMSKYWDELNALEEEGADPGQMRQEIEERYDTEALIDYAVHYYFTNNGDGSMKNWQWFTYDGQRWAVTPYDLDQTFGIGLYGNLLPPHLPFKKLTSGPLYWIDRYYADDIASRYATLRHNRVFDYDNVTAIIDDWYQRVGDEYYAMEKQRWPNSPCYKDAVCNEGWEACSLDDPEYRLAGLGSYNDSCSYQPGDVCWLEGRLWRATASVTGVKPFIINANRDSLERLHDWVKGRIEFLDAYFAYDDTIENAVIAETHPSERRLEAIYTLGGIRVKAPEMGHTYIFRYNDGTSRKVLVR
jgi:hypothetical protein